MAIGWMRLSGRLSPPSRGSEVPGRDFLYWYAAASPPTPLVPLPQLETAWGPGGPSLGDDGIAYRSRRI